jgi:hypothetical protein
VCGERAGAQCQAGAAAGARLAKRVGAHGSLLSLAAAAAAAALAALLPLPPPHPPQLPRLPEVTPRLKDPVRSSPLKSMSKSAPRPRSPCDVTPPISENCRFFGGASGRGTRYRASGVTSSAAGSAAGALADDAAAAAAAASGGCSAASCAVGASGGSVATARGGPKPIARTEAKPRRSLSAWPPRPSGGASSSSSSTSSATPPQLEWPTTRRCSAPIGAPCTQRLRYGDPIHATGSRWVQTPRHGAPIHARTARK